MFCFLNTKHGLPLLHQPVKKNKKKSKFDISNAANDLNSFSSAYSSSTDKKSNAYAEVIGPPPLSPREQIRHVYAFRQMLRTRILVTEPALKKNALLPQALHDGPQQHHGFRE